LEKLLEPQYQNGVLVDGFPRTPVQVGIIKLLHDKMKALRKEFYNTDIGYKFRRPVFRVTVLFVDEQTVRLFLCLVVCSLFIEPYFQSVERQLARGAQIMAHNREVQRTGWGERIAERPTDFIQEAARQRYAIFLKHYDTLKTLKQHFTFNIIPAGFATLVFATPILC